MDNKNTPNMTINIENLHIHMDERMDSTNYYNPTGSCCDECDGCDCDCGAEISDEELIERIHKETGVPMVLIDRILKAEDKVLAQLYADRVEDEADSDEEDPTEDEPHED